MASHSRMTHSRVRLEEEETAQRNITFWRNGFSIEGGRFYDYADAENGRLLEEMNRVVRRCRCWTCGRDSPWRWSCRSGRPGLGTSLRL